MYKFVLIVLFLAFCNGLKTDECSKFKSNWFSIKYAFTSDLMKFSGEKLRADVCDNPQCCDGTMQKEILTVSRLKLKNIAENHFKEIVESFTNDTKAFKDYIQSNLDLTKKELDKMFTDTYRHQYTNNRNLFYDFFEKLSQYMTGKIHKLDEIVDNFMHTLAGRIVQMTEATEKNPRQIRCITGMFLQKQPYQDADKAMKKSLLESYPPARLFLNSLEIVNDIFVDLANEKSLPSWKCAENHAQLFQCSLCSRSELLPCAPLCPAIFSRCLGALNIRETRKISRSWNSLLGVQEKLARRLENAFNFAQINKNLHIQISSAIMNLQNYYPKVKNKILRFCRPNGSRQKRAVSNSWIVGGSHITQFRTQNKFLLSSWIKTYLNKLPNHKTHLKKFKQTVCASSDFKMAAKTDSCWNGTLAAAPGTVKKTKGGKKKNDVDISPSVVKILDRLNLVSRIIKNHLQGNPQDPKTIPVKHVNYYSQLFVTTPAPTPKPVVVDGSGSGPDLDQPRQQQPSPETMGNPEQPIESSGGDVAAPNGQAEQFPSMPAIKKKKPELPRPVNPVTDDEDLDQKPVVNAPTTSLGGAGTNNNLTPGSSIEGSAMAADINGDPKSVPQPIEPQQPSVNPPPVMPTNKRNGVPLPGRPIEGSGDNEPSSSFNNNNPLPVLPQSESRPRIPSTPAPPSPVNPVPMAPQDYPGDVPAEIWIPQIGAYNTNGQLIGGRGNAAVPSYRSSSSVVLFTAGAIYLLYLNH